MLCAQHYTLRPQNRYQPEVRLFFSAHVQNTPSIQHFDTILTPSWLVPPHFWPLSDICRLRRLTFSTYNVLYTKNVGGKNCSRNDEMREATCARTSTSKVPTQIWIMVDLYSVLRPGEFCHVFCALLLFWVNDNLDECQFLHSFHFDSFR